MPVLQNDWINCDHIGASERDREDIMNFSVRDGRGEGLVYYLQHDAFPDEEEGNMRTYLVRDNWTSELAGYFSLKAGFVSFNEVQTDTGAEFDTLPGVELANFALNNRYISKNPDSRGAGLSIFDTFIVPIIEDVAKKVGVKFIYIFALPFDGLRYNEYGFKRFDAIHEAELHKRMKPRYDSECIFMYQMLQERKEYLK